MFNSIKPLNPAVLLHWKKFCRPFEPQSGATLVVVLPFGLMMVISFAYNGRSATVNSEYCHYPRAKA
ncbi:MAG: hypothetical protein R3C11_23525 [Planctomycetaceae bacterium]